ncbi:MAG: 50S ribosomal protein L31e [Candidatus Woesearchaeota archaeon]
MADEKKKKKKDETKIVLERTYNVPLRRKWVNVPKYKRAKKAIFALKLFLSKHMKSDDIKLGKYVNELIWKHGIKNPPHHVKVVVKKDDKGVVMAELEGKEYAVEKKVEKKEKKTGLAGKLQEKIEEGKAVKEEKKEIEAAKKEEPKESPAEKEPAIAKEVEKKVTAPHNEAPVDKAKK